MKYVKGYYVDAKDGRPANKHNLRHGPALPLDDLTVDAVDRRKRPALIIGTLPDDAEVPTDAMEDITEEEHAELMKSYNDWREAYEAKELKKSRDAATLTRADFKLALLERDELENVKAAMSDPSADPRAVILWEDALEFKRMNKDLQALADELGYTEEQLDEIFSISR